ncbi:MAG TPA: aminotransferase, partial [Alphaproteobacteria bacterium]|nr:aminotransferase [Alphaproteobacteria bacterium]
LSNVFFNSGFWVQDLAALVEAIRDTGTLIVIDGYHSFMAVPLDLHAIAGRVFYMSGGYKYAMAGEGCAFLHAPEGYGPRPRNTGWFAEFAELAVHRAGTVGYANDAMRFMGATFDPSGLYRFNAVMDWLEGEGLTVEVMRAHARALQSQLITLLSRAKHKIRPDQALLHPDDPALARFLTFEMDGAQAIQKALMQDGIITDARGRRLRIGFGIYQDEDDVGKLCHALKDGL